MQDVIFEGAETRRPQNLCEVSLLLSECEQQLGTDFHEVEIVRRATRDGQSDYLINGQFCRLKDIHKLFMDTGVGRTSYSVMAQGQIDQVLSSKPEERRAVFEEAAGITRYKSQRREALGKLALTDQNLARVTDVIGEVGRQIGSLRRQASKAIRYKRLNFRLRHLSLAYGGWQWTQLSAMIAALDAEVARLRAAAETQRGKLEAHQRELNDIKARRSDYHRARCRARSRRFSICAPRRSRRRTRRASPGSRRPAWRSASSRVGTTSPNWRCSSTRSAPRRTAERRTSSFSSICSAARTRFSSSAIASWPLSRANEQTGESAPAGEIRAAPAGKHGGPPADGMLRLRSRFEDQRGPAQRTGRAARRGAAGEAAAAERAADEHQRLDAARGEQSRAHNEVQAAQHALAEATQHFRDGQRRLQELDRTMAQRTARLRLLQQFMNNGRDLAKAPKRFCRGGSTASSPEAKISPVTRGT